MTTFVVLAAGRGSRLGRIGDELPKCLLPLNGQAVLSHQLALVPADARVVVVTGYRDLQVMEYVRFAHPDRNVTFVHDDNWGSGPGVSLLAARDAIDRDDDLVFVACDTLWKIDRWLWDEDSSWVAVAPVPAGTPDARWCRIIPDVTGEYVAAVYDKVPDVDPLAVCWTAFAKIVAEDLPTFWAGLENADTRAGEVQLSSGLDAVVNSGEPVTVRHIDWLDVGDEQAYRSAIASLGGYDSLKPDQVTYVIPHKRVIKFHVNRDKVRWRAERAKQLGDVVPRVDESFNGTMIAYDYVEGNVLYDAVGTRPIDHVEPLLDWWRDRFWSTRFHELPRLAHQTTMKFYRDKTYSRVMSLDPALRAIALDAVARVDWDGLVEDVVPGTFHGDFTHANVITWDDDWNDKFISIDWREDFAGVTEWGDLRYDLGKLLGGTRFHWRRASYGDFRRWEFGPHVESAVENYITTQLPEINLTAVRQIAALTLVNSAALHAAPMDEILIARGCHWLETLT